MGLHRGYGDDPVQLHWWSRFVTQSTGERATALTEAVLFFTKAVEREFGARFQDLQDNAGVGMGHAGDGDENVSRPFRQIADVLRNDVKKIVIGARSHKAAEDTGYLRHLVLEDLSELFGVLQLNIDKSRHLHADGLGIHQSDVTFNHTAVFHLLDPAGAGGGREPDAVGKVQHRDAPLPLQDLQNLHIDFIQHRYSLLLRHFVENITIISHMGAAHCRHLKGIFCKNSLRQGKHS